MSVTSHQLYIVFPRRVRAQQLIILQFLLKKVFQADASIQIDAYIIFRYIAEAFTIAYMQGLIFLPRDPNTFVYSTDHAFHMTTVYTKKMIYSTREGWKFYHNT